MVNDNFADVATALTGSVAKDGQTPMSGPFKAVAGSAAAPGIAFANDADTGLFRSASGEMSVASNGVNAGKLISLAAGTAMLFAQTAAPTGWTKSTDHNDKALRVVSGTASSGGSTAFTSVFAARTISTGNLPSHTHTGTTASNGDHAHTFKHATSNIGSSGGGTQATGSGELTTSGSGSTVTTTTTGAHTHTFTSDATGSGTAMDFAVQYVDVIIATKD